MASTDTTVLITPGTGPAAAAVLQDVGGALHDKAVVEWDDGGGPYKANNATPLPVALAGGAVQAVADEGTVAEGTTQGIVVMLECNDSYTALAQNQAGMARGTPDRQMHVAPGAAANGGWPPQSINSAASTNLANLKASPGQIAKGLFTNQGTTGAWVKFYNKTTAPVLSTDTPVLRCYVPAGGGYPLSGPYYFSVGISVAIVGGTGVDTDTTAVSAQQIQCNFGMM